MSSKKEGGGVLNFFGRLFGHHYGRPNMAGLNDPNHSGDTPLLEAIRTQSIDAALALLLDEADPNAANPSTLDTPLHAAAQLANVTLVHLLVVFRADHTLKNAKGRTAFDEVGSHSASEDHKQACLKALDDVSRLYELQKSIYDSSMSPEPVDADSVSLLALDGGGSRGLVMSQVLAAIKERMSTLSPNMPHISTFFDWIAGTSTGAFMAFCLTLLKLPSIQCRKFYFSFKSKSLASHRVYPAKDMEESVQEAFGADAVMADIKGTKVCVATCLADRAPPELHLMTNYGGSRDGQPGPAHRKVWEAARASSAAPTYFPPFDSKFLDGGVMANNPTLDSMVEIFREEKPGVKIGCVLSLGTGVIPPQDLSEGVSIVNPYSPSALLEDYKALKDLADIFISQSTVTNGQELSRAKAWCNCINAPYFRLSPPIESIELDETDNSKLIKMLFDTQLYVFRESAVIDKIARLLLAKSKPAL